ncbi:Uncharacterized protein PBTT_06755 [Plasmodiophora brassicae]
MATSSSSRSGGAPGTVEPSLTLFGVDVHASTMAQLGGVSTPIRAAPGGDDVVGQATKIARQHARHASQDADARRDLLQSVLSDLRDKVAEIERDRWMYEENSEYNAF